MISFLTVFITVDDYHPPRIGLVLVESDIWGMEVRVRADCMAWVCIS